MSREERSILSLIEGERAILEMFRAVGAMERAVGMVREAAESHRGEMNSRARLHGMLLAAAEMGIEVPA